MGQVVLQPANSDKQATRTKKSTGAVLTAQNYLIAGLQASADAQFQRRMFVKFDTPDLRGKTIASAKLLFYCYDALVSSTLVDRRIFAVHNITQEWSFDTLMVEPTFEAIPLSTLIWTGPVSDSWVELDITNAVNNPNGWLIKLSNDSFTTITDNVYCGFRTSSYENASLRPKLIIDYVLTAPIIVSPIAGVVPGDKTIRFEWNTNGLIQSTFEIQWRSPGGDWITVTGNSADSFVEIPGDTFPTKAIEWRLRIQDETGEYTPYSEIYSFDVLGAPQTPSISVQSSARPNISWDGTPQMWQLKITKNDIALYETKTMPRLSLPSFQLPVFLDDGTYKAQVRVRNKYNLWSDWGDAYFNVNTVKPSKPTLVVMPDSKKGLRLQMEYHTPQCYIYRREQDNPIYKLIAKTSELTYLDSTVASGVKYLYFIRSVNSDYGFNDSSETVGIVYLKNAILFDVTNQDRYLDLKYRFDTNPGREISHEKNKALTRYVGREYPVVNDDDFIDQAISLEYFIFANDFKRLVELANAGVILYRNQLGEKIYGTIGRIKASEYALNKTKGFYVTIPVTAIHYNEEVEP